MALSPIAFKLVALALIGSCYAINESSKSSSESADALTPVESAPAVASVESDQELASAEARSNQYYNDYASNSWHPSTATNNWGNNNRYNDQQYWGRQGASSHYYNTPYNRNNYDGSNNYVGAYNNGAGRYGANRGAAWNSGVYGANNYRGSYNNGGRYGAPGDYRGANWNNGAYRGANWNGNGNYRGANNWSTNGNYRGANWNNDGYNAAVPYVHSPRHQERSHLAARSAAGYEITAPHHVQWDYRFAK